jgi:hypothetical protein
MTMIRNPVLGSAVGILLAAGCTPTLAELPARCEDGTTCPSGFECINQVCAAPGTDIPITAGVQSLLYERDIHLVTLDDSVMVTWQIYPYNPGGPKFVGKRVALDGTVSEDLDLVTTFTSYEGNWEPTYDVLAMDNERLLVTASAPSFPGEDGRYRLHTYAVDLPPVGSDFQPTSELAWERRMDSAGAVAIARPKLLARGSQAELGYVRVRIDTSGPAPETVAETAVFTLDRDGQEVYRPACFSSRINMTVAVGVIGGLPYDTGTWWVLDDVRPTVVQAPPSPDGTGEGDPEDMCAVDAFNSMEEVLAPLAIPLQGDANSLLYLEPSERTGDRLSSDPVAGPAKLRRVDASQLGMGVEFHEVIAELPTVRDVPRPAWIARPGGDALLVALGETDSDLEISVYRVDPVTGESSLVASIPRFSELPVTALLATIVDGKLVVSWTDVGEEISTIRVAILEEP